ncbi:MAG TPA: hypothetical protein VH880_05750 [Anaeromyxobacteraceae bacterium]|jgi:hypothetical protein
MSAFQPASSCTAALLVAAAIAVGPAPSPASEPAGPQAQEPAAAPAVELPAAPAQEPAAPAASPLPRWGVMLDAGAPDVLALSALWRPLPWLRLNGGASYLYLAWGLKAGIAWVPFVHWVAPSLNLEYGHYMGLGIAGKVSAPKDAEPMLKSLSLDYVTAELGLELGSGRGWAVFVRGGLGRVWARGGAGSVVDGGGPAVVDGSRTDLGPTKLRLDGPVAKLGFLTYF